MRKTLILCIMPLLLVAGCKQTSGPSATIPADWEYAYDERDQIIGDTPPPQINQNPVIGVKKIIVVAVEWPGEQKLNPTLLQRQIFSSDHDSLRSYILAASGGKLALTGQVITYVSKESRPEYCDRTTYPFNLAVQEGNKGVIANGIDPASYDYQINILDCGGYGSASVAGRNMSVYGQATGTYIYWHEFAHNLGSHHGNTYTKCPQSGNTITAPTGCTTIPYGDSGNTVGGGSFLPDAKARYHATWLDDTQSGLIQKTGLYGLGVLGKTRPQGYRIDRPGKNPPQIVMEYRKPGPYDIYPPDDNKAKGVWIRYSSNNTGSLLTTQVDGTPETATTLDPTFLPGKTLKDEEAGITVAVCTASDDGATIAVAVNGEAAPNCVSVLSLPKITSPAWAAPAAPNPIVFSGKSYAGAKIGITYKNFYEEDGKTLSFYADASGNWTQTLPPLPPGKYASFVWQALGNSASPALPHVFDVAP